MSCAHGVNGRDRAYKFVCHVPRFEKLSRGTGQLNSSLQSGGGSSNLKVRSLTKESYKGGLQKRTSVSSEHFPLVKPPTLSLMVKTQSMSRAEGKQSVCKPLPHAGKCTWPGCDKPFHNAIQMNHRLEARPSVGLGH